MDTINVSVHRGSKGFGLSLIHRGLDKFPAHETGIFVAKIVAGGNSHRAGLRENDKILKINNKSPRDVNDAVEIIKKSGKSLHVTIGRKQPDLLQQDAQDNNFLSVHTNQPPLSRSGSARSLNTQFGQQQGGNSRPQTPGDSYNIQYATVQHHTPTQPKSASLPAPARQSLISQQKQMLQQRQQQQQQEEQLRQQQQQQQQIDEQLRQEQLRIQQVQLEQQRQWEAEQAIKAEEQRLKQAEIARQQEEQRRELEELARQQQVQAEQQRRYEQELRDQELDRERLSLAEQNRRLLEETAELQRQKDEWNAQQYRGAYSEYASSDEEDFVRKSRRSKSVDGRNRSSRPASRTRSPAMMSAMSGASIGALSEISMVSKLSRLEEKMSMQGLNNRLAGYIDKLECIEESQGNELTQIKRLYDKEVQDLKDSIENLTKTYRDLQANSDKILKDNRELKCQDSKLGAQMRDKNESIIRLRDEINKTRYKISTAEKEKSRLGDKLKEALPELNNVKEKLSETEYQLGDLRKVNRDLESQTSAMEKELRDKVRDMDITLKEVKVRKQVEVVEMSGALEKEYEYRVQRALNDLREVYEKQMKEGKGELNKKFEQKVQGLQAQLSKERYKNSSSGQGLEEANRRLTALNLKVRSLDEERERLVRKLDGLGQRQQSLASQQRKEINSKDDEIRKILEKINEQLQEYQNLMQTKVALDMEIGVYRKLVETEEDRLGIDYREDTDSQCLSSRSSAASSPKFKRTTTIQKNSEEYRATRIGVGVSQI